MRDQVKVPGRLVVKGRDPPKLVPEDEHLREMTGIVVLLLINLVLATLLLDQVKALSNIEINLHLRRSDEPTLTLPLPGLIRILYSNRAHMVVSRGKVHLLNS